jgi:hydrogenase maturation protease
VSSAATTEEQPAPLALVVGLGNPILGDDAVGWRVIDALEGRLAEDAAGCIEAGRVGVGRVGVGQLGAVELDRLAVGGLRLMERLADHDRVILVDAVLGSALIGTVTVAPLTGAICRRAGHLDSAHDAPLVEALAAGRALGARLPDEVTVVGIAVELVDEFSDGLSEPVAAAVEPAVEAILELLRGAAADRPAAEVA